MKVRMTAAGTANWEMPVQIGLEQWRVNYETWMVTRYSFDNGRVVHVKTRYAGVDDIDLSASAVTGGFGHIEGNDEDGDKLFGRVDWVVREGYQGGVYTFLGGTGKWKDASGTVEAEVWTDEEEHEQVLPPTGPIRNYGFVDGEGELSVPNLGA
jgi:hypothetical protein